MVNHAKIYKNIEGFDNFRAWNYIISLILEENDLDKYVNEEVPEPEAKEEKDNHKKIMIWAKQITAEFINNHLIPHVSSLKTPKKMFDALT